MDIGNFKTICVVGFSKTGVALVELLLSLGKHVKVTEANPADKFSTIAINKFKRLGVDFEFGGHGKNFVKKADLMVLSPGVDLNNSAVCSWAREFNILTVGEIELASWLSPAKIIAITGTNGKSTTTFLAYKVLKSRRLRVHLAGNIGIPLSSCILKTKRRDLIVLEVSSFQLESILEFKPYIACLLNLEPDHLDRYKSFNEYMEAKRNIFKNQKKDDWALLNKKSPLRIEFEKRLKSKVAYFSSELGNENNSAVYRIASIFGLTKVDCLKVLSEFRGLSHRMQLVKKTRGVTFINDSKATNPASTVWALKNTNKPIILIAGGRDKGLNYSSIIPHLRKVKKINLFGEAALKIKDTLGDCAEVEVFKSFEKVILSSFAEACEKDVVLFSPMCSSFDMFSNYAERGKKFMQIVNSL